MPTLYDCLKPVNSSMFSRAGYSDDTWELLLEFKSTREIRAYKHVSPEAADEVLSAESLGKYFNSQIKGNSTWEFDTLGADPSQQPVEKPKPAETTLGVIDADIKLVEPGWDGEKIVRRDSPEQVAQTNAFLDRILDPAPDCAQPEGEVIKSQSVTLTQQTQGELLGAWTAPESAAEALDLLSERSNEIKAIIAQSKSTGEQALTVRVTDEASHLAASETLKKLVAKKDTTTALLEPFRVVLFSAYEEARGYKAAAITPLEAGEKHIKLQITTYMTAQERERQKKIREAQEAAEAESRRRKAEESQRLTLAEVDDALESGDEQKAQTLFDQPIQAPRPYVQPEYIAPAAPKVEGQSTSTVWKIDRDLVESDETGQAYVASIMKLLAAVKVGTYPIEQAAQLLQWDFSAADKLAGAMMAAFNVPGLQAGPQSTLRVSRGRKKKA